jgi:hypothetical protein
MIINKTAKTDLPPTILGVADSTQYLVGRLDESNSFVALPNETAPTAFRSLAKAKDYLRKLKHPMANLEFQSAYDEMCGIPSGGSWVQLIKL